MNQQSLLPAVEPPKPIIGSGMNSGQRVAGGKDEWLTPPEIVRSLGQFDLDPCSPINRPWPTAATHYTLLDDGLKQPWHGRVWLNPPYGSETGKWLKKLAEHGNGIALIFARTETQDWHTHIWPIASSVFFFMGRIHFCHVDGHRAIQSSGAPSCLVAYGNNNTQTILSIRLQGKLIEIN